MTPGGATELMEVLGKEDPSAGSKAAIEKVKKNYKRTIKMKSSFNKPQSEAITHGKGPALILSRAEVGRLL